MLLEPVRQGDIVDVIAPASRCSPEELRGGVQALKAIGLKPRVRKNLFGKTLLFANTDEVRLAQLREAIYAEDSSLIWCVRGGYGCIRLMDEIRRWRKPKNAKILLGYSDITTLHTYFNQKWSWPTLHGPLLDRLGRGAMSAGEKRQLLGMLFGRVTEVEFLRLKPLNKLATKKSKIAGPVLGGNLTVVQSGLGTPAALEGGKHILFLEDTGERPHRVDRMLCQLRQAGVFNGAKAVVFGHFQLADARDRRDLWRDVMGRFAESVNFPVLRGLPVGHDVKKQYTLPLNTPAELIIGQEGRLRVTSGIRPL